MNRSTTQRPTTDPVLAEVWRIKEEIAAEHGYDVRRIAAAIEGQKRHPHRVVDRSNRNAEPQGVEPDAGDAPERIARAVRFSGQPGGHWFTSTFCEKMRVSALVPILALTLIVTSCDSPLKKAKDEAILKLSDNDPILLKEIVLENLEVEPGQLGSEAIDVKGGAILVLTPERKLLNERGTLLEYPEFSAQVVKFAGGKDFSSLPLSWGGDDLDKLRFICGTSQRTIEAASDLSELEEAVALLTARRTIALSGAFDRLAWLEGDQFSGLLSGDFAKSAWMEFLMRPTAKPDANYLIRFRRKDGASQDHVLTFVQSFGFKPNAEQDGGGQPATRPQSK